MRYAHHNLFQNLKRIKNSKDMTISRELIISEIAKVIVGRPFEVRKILIGCGINISENATRKEIVYAVNFNMARNLCLRNKISALISSNQLPFPTGSTRPTLGEFDTDSGLDKYVNVDGTTTTPTPGQTSGGGMTASDWTSGISTLVGIGYGIWQTGASRKDARAQREHEMELANMNSDLMLKQMDMKASEPTTNVAGVGGGTSTMTWVILGIGAVAVVIFAVVASKRNRAMASAPAQVV